MSASDDKRHLLAIAPLLLVVAIAGCGGMDGADGTPGADGKAEPPPVMAADAPPALAANLEQANEIIDGGADALEAKLDDLSGHPVVVNQWGSWCPPCRAEFPFFAESAAAHAEQVAFLGVDVQDGRDAAEDFLAEFPTPYPHVFDQDAEAVRTLDWGGVSPTTWFIDERGEIVHQRPGVYPDRAALEADIEAHLLTN